MRIETFGQMLAVGAVLYVGIGVVIAAWTWTELRKSRPDQPLRDVVPVFLRFLPVIVLAWPVPQWFR